MVGRIRRGRLKMSWSRAQYPASENLPVTYAHTDFFISVVCIPSVHVLSHIAVLYLLLYSFGTDFNQPSSCDVSFSLASHCIQRRGLTCAVRLIGDLAGMVIGQHTEGEDWNGAYASDEGRRGGVSSLTIGSIA